MIYYTCYKCNYELQTIKNGVLLVRYIDGDPAAGIDEMRQGDLCRCMKCGFEIVAGLAPKSQKYIIDPVEVENIIKKNYVVEVLRHGE